MKQNFEKLLRDLPKASPPHDLHTRVMTQIVCAEKRAQRIWVMWYSIISLGSLAGMYEAVQFIIQDITKSGLLQYLSILFSDGGTLLGYWKEFMLLLAESLPIFGLALFFATVFVFLESIKLAVKHTKTGMRYGY
jgi:hypothetical protein